LKRIGDLHVDSVYVVTNAVVVVLGSATVVVNTCVTGTLGVVGRVIASECQDIVDVDRKNVV
jgi:hypothetical protein